MYKLDTYKAVNLKKSQLKGFRLMKETYINRRGDQSLFVKRDEKGYFQNRLK